MTKSKLKVISYSELAKHTTQDSLWMEIKGGIYDVTTFINDHPGGSTILINKAGRIASEAFDITGHS